MWRSQIERRIDQRSSVVAARSLDPQGSGSSPLGGLLIKDPVWLARRVEQCDVHRG
jgi:hypothetical protein